MRSRMLLKLVNFNMPYKPFDNHVWNEEDNESDYEFLPTQITDTQAIKMS